LIDRVDIHVEVPPVAWKDLRSREGDGLSSADIRKQVVFARGIQRRRFSENGTATNATMSSRQVREHCRLDAAGESLLKRALSELGLSARAHDKILRVARTIADLEGEANVASHHVAEAVQYRRLDRKL
jgi:magnesium chelatase family protein